METFFSDFLKQIPESVILLLYAYGLLVVTWPVFLALEWWTPPGERTPGSNFLYNWKIVLSNLLLTPIFYAFAVAFSTFVATSFSLPALPYPVATWSLGVPILDGIAHGLVLYVTSAFLLDFSYYWWHRMQHELPAMWELHKLHHSDENLNVTTLYRSHCFELAGQALLRGLSVGLVFDLAGVPQAPFAVICAGLLPPLWDVLIHANIRIDALRFLLPLHSTPQYHWIHHSKLPQHQDKNYAIWLPLFDVIFGTYYRPSVDEYPPTGLSTGEKAGTVCQEQIGPFLAWQRMFRERRSSESRS